ncbi:Histidine phosphatase [Gracilaria domingensis]|nr:Histidine phosphatase [Gracilaria domingensis]
MAGLYPPGTAPNHDVRVRFGKDALHENEGGLPHLYQPVPIHTESIENDMLLLPDRNCPRLDRILRRNYKAPAFLNKLEEERAFLRTAAKIAKRDPDSFSMWDLEQLSDTWTCFQHHSVPLPDQATPEIVSRAQNLSYWLGDYVNRGVEVNRLRAGLILYDVRQFMTIAALKSLNQLSPENEKAYKKFVLYSAHDTTVAATLAALQAFDGVNPPYNSTLIWELYGAEATSDFYVKVEYNGRPLVLPGCPDALCPADQYIRSTRKRTVEGEGLKKIECLIGFRRFAAMVGSIFSTNKPSTPANIVFNVEDDTSGASSVGAPLILVITSVVILIGACGVANRLRSKYNGYQRASDMTDEDASYRQPIVQDHVSERRILM